MYFFTIRMTLIKNNFVYIWFSWSISRNLHLNFGLAKSNAINKVHLVNRIQLCPAWFHIERNSFLPDFGLKKTGQLNGWVPPVHLDWYHFTWKWNSSNNLSKRKIIEKVNVTWEKEGLLLFLSFLHFVNNSRILRIPRLFTE